MPPKKRKAGAASPKGAKKSKVKAEPGAAVAPRKRTGHAHQVVAALRSAPGGMAQDALAASCSLTKSELAAVLNQLAQKRRIQMAKGPDGDILFMLASEKEVENANKLDELSTNELHVYQVIQEKGRDGIWKRDIKHRTGLVEKEVNKILNKLEKQRLIKMEKTVLRMNGKMFFLYDVAPSAEHTGGVWYSRPVRRPHHPAVWLAWHSRLTAPLDWLQRPEDPPEFDTVGVRHIADACHKFVQDVGAPTHAPFFSVIHPSTAERSGHVC